MSHLRSERLAALADEAPTAAELAHLAGCAECSREREAYRNLIALAAGESVSLGTPLTSWDRLAPALAADGILEGSASRSTPGRGRRVLWLQAAAAVLLVAGGTFLGRYSAGASLLPTPPAAASTTAAAPVVDSLPRFVSVDDARAAQSSSQLLYQAATAFIAQRDSAAHPGLSTAAMRTRLAALDRATEAMGEALNEAPYDPVINGYYLTTLGQREATLRQINMVMPASMRITSY